MSKTGQPKTKIQEGGIPVTFLGIGSYNYVKEKKNLRGYFWTVCQNKYFLMKLSPSIKEEEFNSYKEMIDYCQKSLKNFVILT